MTPVDCKTAARWMDLKRDGRLPVADGVLLEAHLSGCAGCGEWARELEEVDELLRGSRRSPSPHFTDRVLHHVAAERGVARPPMRSGLVVSWAWLPVAAVILVVVGLVVGHEISERRVASVEPPQVAIELELADVQARTVAVAGDFNGWDAARMVQGADGVWRVRLSLTPGRYQYAFVIDGEKWIADPHSSTVVDSGFSGSNSVLDVSL
jgi:hypothetical protein